MVERGVLGEVVVDGVEGSWVVGGNGSWCYFTIVGTMVYLMVFGLFNKLLSFIYVVDGVIGD